MKETKSNYCEHCGEFHDRVGEYVSEVRVGETVPDFEFEVLRHGKVEQLSLSSLRGTWTVLVFYPADFTRVCPTELEELSALYPDFKKAGAEVISVSCDTIFAHEAWRAASPAIRAIPYPMAADPSGKLAYAFGILNEGGDAHLSPDEGLAGRGTFIIDPHGVLRGMEIVDGSIGRSGRETLRKVQALTHVETHKGAACPASWQPGDDTL